MGIRKPKGASTMPQVKTVSALIAELYHCLREGSATYDTPVMTPELTPVYVTCTTMAVVITDMPDWPPNKPEPDPRD
jgi:hypothetical protein